MNKDKGIVLSEKHGLNPTMGVCFWCGKETGEIALLGKLKNDVEAPRYMVLSYEPCKECEENRKKGYTLLEVTPHQPTQTMPPITKEEGTDYYPTGRWLVLTQEAAERIFKESAKTSKAAFVDTVLFSNLTNNKGDD